MQTYILLFMFISFPSLIFGQVSVQNLDLDSDINDWYNKSIKVSNHKGQQGQYYQFDYQTIKNHQFYKSMAWKQGSLRMNNHQYDTIGLLYNTYNDILITQNEIKFQGEYFGIRPNQQIVKEFTIHGDKFVNYYDSTSSLEGAGFYQQIYEGKEISFLAKRKKKQVIQNKLIQYQNDDKFYLLQNDVFARIKSRTLLYKLFPELKKDLKQYQKQNLTHLNNRSEAFLKALIQYCDTLLIQS